MLKDVNPNSQAGFESSSLEEGLAGISLPGLAALCAETAGDPAICVAVLDGPVDTSHPCFQGAQLTVVQTLVAGVADRGPASVHGTHVASIIFGQHDGTVRGIAPSCRGLIVPVFTSASDDGVAPCSQIDLARAITGAVQHGAHVINISGGQLSDSDEAHPMLENAVQHCADSGVLIVAAVGNDGCQCLHVPAAMSSVLAVGGADARGLPLAISNWGQAYRGVLAPGENIPGAVPHGGIARRTGTSFATPVVSGIVALLLSLQVKRGNKPDPRAVREAILASADSCDPQIYSDCPRFLVGRLNAEGARAIITATTQELQVAAAMSTQLATEPTLNLNERSTEMSEFNELDAPHDGLRQSSMTDRLAPTPEVEHDDAQVVSPLPAKPAVPSPIAPAAVTVSSCSCSNPAEVAPHANRGSGPLVYAVGSLSFDFGTEARRDSVQQAIGENELQLAAKDKKTYMEVVMDHLSDTDYPWNAQAVIWTLEFDGTPVYAIQPHESYAHRTYAKLADFKSRSLKGEADRVSVGGFIAGQTRLLNGQIVPVIVLDSRSLRDWNLEKLVAKIAGGSGSDRKLDKVKAKLRLFMERIYDELRNMGMTPQERAINFATTAAFEKMNEVFVDTCKDNLELDRITVEQSPVSRPQSDCWDVKLTFFDPKSRFETAKKAYRFTVDVSDVIPVTIGGLRQWSEY